MAKFSTSSSKRDAPFFSWADKVSYQRCLTALLANRCRGKDVTTVFNVVFPCHDEEWSQLWLLGKCPY